MDRKVDIFLIGARKAATTTVAAVMDEHAELSVCEGKEPEFFNRIDASHQDIVEYHKLYDKQCKYWIDASTIYSIEDVAHAIHLYNPNAKIIYILRNPLQRIISHYKMDRERKYNTESLNTRIEDKDQLVTASCYYDRLVPYIEKFGRQNVLTLRYEDLDNNLLYDKIKYFLKLDSNFKQVQLYLNNSTNNYRLPHHFDKYIKSRYIQYIKKCVPNAIIFHTRKFIYNLTKNELDLDITDINMQLLRSIINPQLDQLAPLIDFDIKDWYIK